MHQEGSAYGLWGIALIESAFFIVFAFSFTRPKTSRDWRSFGAFSAFILALFAEMYGFPLTIFLLSGWLAHHCPGVNFLSHDSGHLLHTLLGLKGDPHMDPLHIVSEVLIVGGLFLLASSCVCCMPPRNRRHSPQPVLMHTYGIRSISHSSVSCSASCCSGRRFRRL